MHGDSHASVGTGASVGRGAVADLFRLRQRDEAGIAKHAKSFISRMGSVYVELRAAA